MGRFTAYDQNGRMVADFDKSGYDLMRMRQGYDDEIERLTAGNAKLLWLVNDMLACFRIGAERDGVSRQWCYELFDSYMAKLRELGVEVER